MERVTNTDTFFYFNGDLVACRNLLNDLVFDLHRVDLLVKIGMGALDVHRVSDFEVGLELYYSDIAFGLKVHYLADRLAFSHLSSLFLLLL